MGDPTMTWRARLCGGLAVMIWVWGSGTSAAWAGGAEAPRQGGAVRTLAIGPGVFGPPIAQFDERFSYDEIELEEDCGNGSVAPGILCETVGGLNHVVAGEGLRNRGAGTISLTGAPPGATPVAAWVYWAFVDDGPPTVERDLVFEGITVMGAFLGGVDEPCWSGGASLDGYRASVTHLLHPGINGDYEVSGVPSSRTDGADAWRYGGSVPMAEGASLLVVYSDPALPSTSRVMVHDGAAELLAAVAIDHPLTVALPTASRLRHSRIGADGQAQHWLAGEPVALTPTCTRLEWNGASELIRGFGSAVDLSSDWQGSDGNELVGLWDSETTEMSLLGSLLAPGGSTSYRVLYEALPRCVLEVGTIHADCVRVLAHALTLY